MFDLKGFGLSFVGFGKSPQTLPTVTQRSDIEQERDALLQAILEDFKEEQDRLIALKASVFERLNAHYQRAALAQGLLPDSGVVPSLTSTDGGIKVDVVKQNADTISGEDLAVARQLFIQWRDSGERDADTIKLLDGATTLDEKGQRPLNINKLKEVANKHFDHEVLKQMAQHIKNSLFVRDSKLQIRVYHRVGEEKEMQQVSLNFSRLSVES